MHHHLCRCCETQKVPCDGTWSLNHDGAPEVICDLFHLAGGELNPECICDVCRIRRDRDDEEAA